MINPDQHVTGHPDGPLSETGRRHTRRLAELLRDVPIAAIFSAGPVSSQQTAAELTQDRRTQFVVDHLLDPINLDSGETFERTIAAFIKIVRAWQDRTIVIVSDAAVLQALLCQITATDVRVYRRFAVPPASVILAEVAVSGKGVLHVLNWDLDFTKGAKADHQPLNQPTSPDRIDAGASLGRDGRASESEGNVPTTCRVYLIRHGQAMTVEEGGQVWSHHPVGLTPKGQEQARHAGEMLRNVKFDAIYTSDLNRARETADAVAAPHNLEPIVEPGLREIALGRFEGMTLAHVYSEADDRFIPWLEVTFKQRFASEEFHHPADLVFPEGESILVVHGRTLEVFRRIIRAHLDETIAIVSHTWVIQPLICYLTGGDPRNYYRYTLRYATVTLAEVDTEGRGVLEILNGGLELSDVAGGRLFATVPLEADTTFGGAG